MNCYNLSIYWYSGRKDNTSDRQNCHQLRVWWHVLQINIMFQV